MYRIRFDALQTAWKVAVIKSKGRFYRSTIGDYWPVLNNMVFAFVLGPIYATARGLNSELWPFVAYLGCGVMLWDFVTKTVTSALGFSFSNRQFLIDSNIPAQRLIQIEFINIFRDFLRSILCLFVILGCFDQRFWAQLFVGLLSLIPVAAFLYYLYPLLAIAGALYPDIRRLLPMVFRIMFLSLPILYLPGTLSRLPPLFLLLNPFYQLVSFSRSFFLGQPFLGRLTHAYANGSLPHMPMAILLVVISSCFAAIAHFHSERLRFQLVTHTLR